jgi:3'-phosphoadenosine 5'-phosphosulfate sulfotransferase (PAPS reductase)/FAD synthetase
VSATLFDEYGPEIRPAAGRQPERRLSPYRLNGQCRIAFSGGRTSGKMLWEFLQENGGPSEQIAVVFANTGREDERTLEFVRECENRWQVPIYWLEYCRNPEAPSVTWRGAQPQIGCHSFRQVSFETASRKGEPFEDLLRVKADFRREAKSLEPILPNVARRFCSAELKHRTADRFVEQVLGWREYQVAIGLRADEPKRVANLQSFSTERREYVCPLYDAGVTEAEVFRFWKSQPFDLQLSHDPLMGTYEGNCDFCFMKRRGKILRLAVERPEALEWWARQESWTGQNFRQGRFTYTDLIDGRGNFTILGQELEEEGSCLCTD